MNRTLVGEVQALCTATVLYAGSLVVLQKAGRTRILMGATPVLADLFGLAFRSGEAAAIAYVTSAEDAERKLIAHIQKST